MIARISDEIKKYKIKVTNGRFQIDNEKILNIVNDLKSLICNIGVSFFLKYLFDELHHKKFNNKVNRYLMLR